MKRRTANILHPPSHQRQNISIRVISIRVVMLGSVPPLKVRPRGNLVTEKLL